jgi:membrane protease subunit (stomatin/prohibitin family)
MAAFNGRDGGVLDAIRCDEPDYLIWKWHPKGTSGGGSERANAIRLGSSLRVRDGSVAAFVYSTADGANQDYIEGPYDGIVSTGNLPVMATLIGKLYDSATPFPAEVYFINLADLIQIKFGVPYFDVFDPRFTDYGIPTAVRGSINFKISDYREFIKLHRLDSFDMGTFQVQVKDTIVRLVKEVVANAPSNDGIPAVQIERHIGEVNALVEAKMGPALYQDYGVTVQRVDISDIEIDKSSEGYRKLQSITQNKANVFAQAAANVVDTMQTHRVGAKRIVETNREEGKQVAAGKGLGEIGKNVTEAIGGIIGGLGKQKEATPPPIPVTQYYVVLDSEQAGPFDMGALADLAGDGKIEATTLAWKDGMGSWEEAGTIPELGRLFGDRGDAAPRAVE